MLKQRAAPPDPNLILNDRFASECYRQTLGVRRRAPVIDPSKETLVLIGTGQSQLTNLLPSVYVPYNTAKVDNFNLYDGGLYEMNGALLGASSYPGTGSGNLLAYICDALTDYWDRIICVPLAIGSTSIGQWGAGDLSYRGPAALRRLAAIGIAPDTPGVTFFNLMMIGETDGQIGTSQASFVASAESYFDTMIASGFAGKFGMTIETWLAGATNATIRAAQSELITDRADVHHCGDLDFFNNDYRYDTTHFSNEGAAAVAAAIVEAMHLIGPPY